MFIEFPVPTDVVVQGMDEIRLPKMIRVSKRYDARKIADVSQHIRERMNQAVGNQTAYQGKRICVTAGSRGIPHMAEMLRTICAVLREWGAEPFVIPAMGSHGGGTAQGQRELLAGYGVTEETVGAPIHATMEVVPYGRLSSGLELYCDRFAQEADGIVVFHKIKPHTDFRGKHESGLAKMIAIGIANHVGAAAFHAIGFSNFAKYVPEAAEVFLAQRDLVLGLGVVQNAFDDICTIEAAEKDGFMELDAALLAEAKEKIAKFPIRDVDILVIDEIGKNISGWGHDPNITGRTCVLNPEGFSDNLQSRFMVVLGLTEETHHNGCGLGVADMTTRRCLNSVDWGTTWTNMFNNMELQGGRIPMYAETDCDAIRYAVRCLTADKRDAPKILHIKNTAEMNVFEVSPQLYEEIRALPGIEACSNARDWAFDANGFLEKTE